MEAELGLDLRTVAACQWWSVLPLPLTTLLHLVREPKSAWRFADGMHRLLPVAPQLHLEVSSRTAQAAWHGLPTPRRRCRS